MASRLLRISSKDRSIDSKSASDMFFNTNDSDLHQIRKVVLKSAIIPNTCYNVSEHYNTLYLQHSLDATTSYAITPGQYTLAHLISALLAVLPAGTTIVQNPITRKLTFGMTGTFKLFAFPKNPMGRILGIAEDTAAGLSTFNITGLPNLTGLRHIYVQSSVLSNQTVMVTNDKSKHPIFCDFPVTVPWGESQAYDGWDGGTNQQDFMARKNINAVDIKLLDEHNQVLELNGHDWVMIFRVW